MDLNEAMEGDYLVSLLKLVHVSSLQQLIF